MARPRPAVNYREQDDGDDDEEASYAEDDDDEQDEERSTRRGTRSRRPSTRVNDSQHGNPNDVGTASGSKPPLRLKIKAAPARATRNSATAVAQIIPPSDAEEQDAQGDDDEEGNSPVPKGNADMKALNFEDEDDDVKPAPRTVKLRTGRMSTQRYNNLGEEDSDEDSGPKSRSRAARARRADAENSYEEDTDEYDNAPYGGGRKRRHVTQSAAQKDKVAKIAQKRRTAEDHDKDFELDDDDDDEDMPMLHDEESDDLGGNEPSASQGTSYGLRQRKPVNYQLPKVDPKTGRIIDGESADNFFPRRGPLTFVDDTPKRRPPRKKGGWNGLPTTMSGKDYAKLFGEAPDSSDDDVPSARRVLGAGLGGGAMLGGMPASVSGLLGGAGGLGAFGGGATAHGLADKDAQLGRIKPGSDGLADVDPFGPNMQVDFSSIGGLDSHVQQLKEMVSLPLLYPELFTRFKVTPPRGVLFHGPPGTGKTLVARALAASCSTEGQQISFFMRKGADCLSKWVGEAERQLRLLFEEAKNAQPSIIFFDEIDGLAPVRSSKQDQIHASIVSTLLALMDGMDGRGQVVVIGATNRPDSVDPALRRPGRFDREFYFPLPDRKARRAILDIHTRGWEPPLSDEFKERLAEVTKGYGGADLRALCTEAALNAIQRRYPQIYKTNDRLLLEPETIHVDAKDFMMSVNKVVPSSKRAGTGSAAALPEHFQPLLGHAVQQAVQVLDSVMPPVSKRNALEEALYEDEAPVDLSGGSNATAAFGATAATARARDGGFGRELLLQSFETLRVFKPRVLIHGDEGMGQGIVGAAILHHLEGYHVQPLDIATLLGDSSRTPEAAVIQIFQEAKRHKPSIMYIPGLIHWANSVPEGVRTTLKSLLDSLSPSDPVMLLAVAEAPIAELRPDVRNWFGFLPGNKFQLVRPNPAQRHAFFSELLGYVVRPPTEFPDGVPRRKRVLESLPIAPPRAKKEPTKAELEQLRVQDERTLEHLKFRLSPVLAELRKKFKRFCRDARVEYNLQNLVSRFDYEPPSGGKIVVHLVYNQPVKGARGAQLVSPQKPSTPALSILDTQEAGSADPVTDVAAGRQAQSVIGGPAVAAEASGTVAVPATSLDGDSSMLDADSQPQATSSQLVPPMLSITAEGGAPPATPVKSAQNGDSLQIPTGAVAATEAPGDAYKRDMTIWLLSLDKMHTRLFNSHYLTAEEFLDDVQKLVSNAEEAAEVDEDRVTKAYEMRTLALILIEQFVDPAFRLECNRMAKRVREREAAAAAEAKGKAGEQDGAKEGTTEGQGESSTGSASLKRGREATAVNGSAGTDDAEAANRKRQRQTPQPASNDAFSSNEAPAGPSQSHPASGPSNPVGKHGPMGMDSLLNGSNVSRSPARTTAGQAPTSLPAFVVDQNALRALADHMVGVSADFTIEQLEQLRAAAFNVVWHRRTEWNRMGLINELFALTNHVADAVRLEGEAAKAD